MTDVQSADVIVAGSGLAGLTAAAFAARAGRSVILCERARGLGGRATTHTEGDFLFNQGPHALYSAGAGRPILEELGVRPSGNAPAASGGYAVDGGRKHALPGGFVSLLTTGLLRLPEKLELARTLGALARIDPTQVERMTLEAWLDERFRHTGVRNLIRALVRLTSYANAPEVMSAGAAVAQLQRGVTGGVLYLDGGWQSLVDGLRRVALEAGVRILSGTRVEAVEGEDAVRGVRLADGRLISASAVVLTGGPGDVSAAVREGRHLPLRRWEENCVPMHAACLDLGLSRLPQTHATFALGIDRPLYFSVHSAAAKLAPQGAAVIQVARYLAPRESTDPRETERELENLLDLVQPGWRAAVLRRRFLPHMTVAHHLPLASEGGTEGRAPVGVPGFSRLFVAGDWVGPHGLLADCSLASGRQAGEQAAASAALSKAA
jgi:phytoene dehydrogenase-like protein